MDFFDLDTTNSFVSVMGLVRKFHSTPKFKRPVTYKLLRNPKFEGSTSTRENKLDEFRIIRHPLTTESAMKMIEEKNILVFNLDQKATKNNIKLTIKKLYDIKAVNINILNCKVIIDLYIAGVANKSIAKLILVDRGRFNLATT